MLHFHFGAGRLGLGLVAPFFQQPGSELYLLNRASSTPNTTGTTTLDPRRRNQLLQDHPRRQYFIQKPGGLQPDRQTVGYHGFSTFDEKGLREIVTSIARKSPRSRAGIVVTASILSAASYGPVLEALDALAQMKEEGSSVGRIFLVACENTVDAHDVLQDEAPGRRISAVTRRHITGVSALVDRICVGLEEDSTSPHPTVLVRAEEYGSLKLKMDRDTEPLAELCQGSRVEFSRHIEVEKQIKSWLVNGTHWLIALTAFQAGRGNADLKLNEYLNAEPEHRRFADTALAEMSEGIAELLRGDPRYAGFVADVDVEDYLEGARRVVLNRFSSTHDPISRILARFRAPSEGEVHSLEAFIQRFGSRIDAPMKAYERARGFPPPMASKGILNLFRLIASQQFINATAQG